MMPIDIVLVDSNIWLYAYAKARQKEYEEIHQLARSFFQNLIQNPKIKIATTSYHISEIIDLLRKANVDKQTRIEIFEGFKSAKFIIKELVIDDIEVCFKQSLHSGIHIYDYLVVLPLKGMVSKIYSADNHFQHQDFKEIAEVVNPISPWILGEGRRPIKRK